MPVVAAGSRYGQSNRRFDESPRPSEPDMLKFAQPLLRPSLHADAGQPRAAPYSSTTGFLSAFFGGPFALLGITALNVHRAGRWKADVAWWVAGVILALSWFLLLPRASFFPVVNTALVEALGRGAWRYADRAFSLGLFGVAYWRHRSLDRAADLFGLRRPNGWIAGVGAIVLGTLASALMSQRMP